MMKPEVRTSPYEAKREGERVSANPKPVWKLTVLFGASGSLTFTRHVEARDEIQALELLCGELRSLRAKIDRPGDERGERFQMTVRIEEQG